MQTHHVAPVFRFSPHAMADHGKPRLAVQSAVLGRNLTLADPSWLVFALHLTHAFTALGIAFWPQVELLGPQHGPQPFWVMATRRRNLEHYFCKPADNSYRCSHFLGKEASSRSKREKSKGEWLCECVLVSVFSRLIVRKFGYLIIASNNQPPPPCASSHFTQNQPVPGHAHAPHPARRLSPFPARGAKHL